MQRKSFFSDNLFSLFIGATQQPLPTVTQHEAYRYKAATAVAGDSVRMHGGIPYMGVLSSACTMLLYIQMSSISLSPDLKGLLFIIK